MAQTRLCSLAFQHPDYGEYDGVLDKRAPPPDRVSLEVVDQESENHHDDPRDEYSQPKCTVDRADARDRSAAPTKGTAGVDTLAPRVGGEGARTGSELGWHNRLIGRRNHRSGLIEQNAMLAGEAFDQQGETSANSRRSWRKNGRKQSWSHSGLVQRGIRQ